MRQTKQLAMMFVLGAVLVGGVLGFAVDRVVVGDKMCPRAWDQRAMRAQLSEDLMLTADQKVAMDRILDERNRLVDSIVAPVRPQMSAVRDTAWQRIAALLTPEQRQRFDAMRAEMKARKAHAAGGR